MSKRMSVWALSTAALLLTTAATCADDAARSAKDAARAVKRSADDLVDARRLQAQIDEALAAARNAAADAAESRINSAVDQIEALPEVKEALRVSAWEVGCDVVAGNIPGTLEDVEQWLVQKAAGFGVEFLGDGAGLLADALLATLDTQTESSDVSAACQRIRESGL